MNKNKKKNAKCNYCDAPAKSYVRELTTYTNTVFDMEDNEQGTTVSMPSPDIIYCCGIDGECEKEK